MRTIPVTCPSCQAQYQVKADNLGQQAQCKCGRIFTVEKPLPALRNRDRGDEAALEESATRNFLGQESIEQMPLTPCRHCGFQDRGNFCSMCGARLAGSPDWDLEKYKVPQWISSKLPGGGKGVQGACGRYNQAVEALQKLLQREGVPSVQRLLTRERIAVLARAVPAALPGREALVARLWSLAQEPAAEVAAATAAGAAVAAATAAGKKSVSNSAMGLKPISAGVDAYDSGDEKTAAEQQAAMGMAQASADAGGESSRSSLDSRTAARGVLAARSSRQAGAVTDQRGVSWRNRDAAGFAQLLAQADKLAASKAPEAARAYQDCLYWLSRHELPQRKQVQRQIEEKLRQVKNL